MTWSHTGCPNKVADRILRALVAFSGHPIVTACSTSAGYLVSCGTGGPIQTSQCCHRFGFHHPKEYIPLLVWTRKWWQGWSWLVWPYVNWTLGMVVGWLVGCPKFTSRTIKYSASAISIAAPSVNANIFMTPLSFSVWIVGVGIVGSDFLTVAGASS